MSNLDFERRLDQAIRRRVDQAIREEIGERLQAILSRDAVDIPPRLRELVVVSTVIKQAQTRQRFRGATTGRVGRAAKGKKGLRAICELIDHRRHRPKCAATAISS